MRSFPIIPILLFVAFFLLIATASFFNLRKLVSTSVHRQKILLLFALLNAAILAGFFLLYIYPFNPRQATSFPVYFYYNTFLFAVFLFNLPMALAWAVHFISDRKRRSRVIPFMGFIPALGLAIGMFYGTFAGSKELKVTNVTVTFDHLPRSFDGYRIVQLSDLHLGGMINAERLLKKTRNEVAKTDPDLILFTGDLVNNFAQETNGLQDEMKQISRLAPGYSILGNHDYGDYTRWNSPEKKTANLDAIVDSHGEMGFQLLRNAHVVLRQGPDSLFLAGVENWGHPPFPQYADLDAALKGIPPGAFTVLMTHDPAHWESLVAGKVPVGLTLSGHTHGMQWAIKGAGIPFSIAHLTRKTWGGLYRHDNQLLYVNTGLGTVGMPWRLDMPAEITVITLKRSEVNGKQ